MRIDEEFGEHTCLVCGTDCQTTSEMLEEKDQQNAKLRADNKALLDAAKAARLHLADYSRRLMFGTDCDDDVRKAQDILRAAIEHSEPQ